MPTTPFELTGQVILISAPKQATKRLWHRDLVLAADEFNQPGEGVIKIQFAGEQMALADEVQVGDTVTVKFLIRGVEYYWEGATKHLVVLIGQHLRIHSFRRKPVKKSTPQQLTNTESNSSQQGDSTVPQIIRLGSRMLEAPLGEDPPF